MIEKALVQPPKPRPVEVKPPPILPGLTLYGLHLESQELFTSTEYDLTKEGVVYFQALNQKNAERKKLKYLKGYQRFMEAVLKAQGDESGS